MYEYVVSPAKQPIWKLKRTLAVIGYIVYAVTVFSVGAYTKLLLPMMALVPLSTWILVFFTWRYVAVEYEYSFVSGTMTLTKILGGRARKKVLEVRIKELHTIAPNFKQLLFNCVFSINHNGQNIFFRITTKTIQTANSLLKCIGRPR